MGLSANLIIVKKAAAKCRQKSKKSVSELQRREREMLQQNRFLTAAAGSLREEVLGLKNEILRHSRCDSEVSCPRFVMRNCSPFPLASRLGVSVEAPACGGFPSFFGQVV